MSMSQATVQAIGFGPPDRRLFGIYHPAAPIASHQAGVVLCNAFGQEGIRAHRMMRVLAERLARAGHAVMRFDYFGTGDAMGDDLDGDLFGWAADLHEADRELRRRSGVSHTAWLGMRLGAAVALRAAQTAPVGLSRLVLWDPVLDGVRYLQHLRACHVASLEEAFSLPPVPAPAELARDPAQFQDEAIGFALSVPMREQLASLRPDDFRWPARPAAIAVIADPDDADGRDVALACAREPGRVNNVALHHGTDWTSDTADNSALVPAQALMQLVKLVGAPR